MLYNCVYLTSIVNIMAYNHIAIAKAASGGIVDYYYFCNNPLYAISSNLAQVHSLRATPQIATDDIAFS